MAAPTTWTVVRDILTANLALTADEVIAKAKAKGVKTPDDAIRTTVHTLRKRLKKKAAGSAPAVKAVPAPKPTPTPKPAAAAGSGPPTKPVATPAPKAVPAAARQVPAASTSAVLRSILAADLALPADAVLARAKAKGVTVPDAKLRAQIHNLRSELKRQAAKAGAATPPVPPKPTTPAPVVPPTATVAVTGVLANVTLVHAAVAACGGVGQARRVAEAVQACGGVEAFSQYLELVAGVRGGAV